MNESTQSVAPKASENTYQNNPFFVATDGIDRLFKKAMPIGVLFAILSFAGLLGSLPGSFTPPQNMESTTSQNASQQSQQQTPAATSQTQNVTPQNRNEESLFGENNQFPTALFAVGGVIILMALAVALFIGIVIKGVSDFTAAQLANGNEVGFGEAFKGVFGSFWGYTWVLVIVGVKIFLWSLLFIIPGIIMAIRYTFAGVSYFDGKGKGNAAVKDSLALTKGAWLTTFASHTLFNMITFGIVQSLLEPGTNSVLYGQFRPLTDAGEAKPKAHGLSWLTLILVLVLVLSIIGLVAFALYAIANYFGSTAP